MLKAINQNVILTEDMGYILLQLSPVEKDRIKDRIILIKDPGGFLSYYLLHPFTTNTQNIKIFFIYKVYFLIVLWVMNILV